LEWSLPLANARTYVVERREGNGGVFRRIKTFRGGVSSYVDADVEPLATYSYRIRARNGAGASPWSQLSVVVGPASGLGS
jgi:fibronectin type 3 domain-containing protein